MLSCKPPSLWSSVVAARADTGAAAPCGQRRVSRPQFVGPRPLFPEQSPLPSSHVSAGKTMRLRCKRKGIHDSLSWEAAVAKRKVTLKRIKELHKVSPPCMRTALGNLRQGVHPGNHGPTPQRHSQCYKKRHIHKDPLLSAPRPQFLYMRGRPAHPALTPAEASSRQTRSILGPFIHCAPRFMPSTNQQPGACAYVSIFKQQSHC